MAGIIFARPTWLEGGAPGIVTASVLSATNLIAATPAENLFSDQPTDLIQTSSLNDGSTNATVIKIDAGSALPVNFVAVMFTNSTFVGTMKLEFSNNSAFPGGGGDIDTGYIAMPASFGLAWLITSGLRRHGFKAVATVNRPDEADPATFRYMRLSLKDAANPAGFLRVGRLIVSRAFTLSHAFSFGAAVAGVDDPSPLSALISGQTFARPYEPRPTAGFTVSYLTEAEAMLGPVRLQRLIGGSRPLAILLDKDETTYGELLLHYGRLQSQSVLTLPQFDLYEHSYQILGMT